MSTDSGSTRTDCSLSDIDFFPSLSPSLFSLSSSLSPSPHPSFFPHSVVMYALKARDKLHKREKEMEEEERETRRGKAREQQAHHR